NTLVSVDITEEYLFVVGCRTVNHSVYKALRYYDYVVGTSLGYLLAHVFVNLPGLCNNLGRIIILCTRPLQHKGIEGNEGWEVEIHNLYSRFQFIVQICPHPVEYGHKVVHYYVNTTAPKVAERFLVVCYQTGIVVRVYLDTFRYRQTFHNAPAHTMSLNLVLYLHDLVNSPHLSIWNMVQSRHNTFNTYLTEVGQFDGILVPKPSHGFFESHKLNDLDLYTTK